MHEHGEKEIMELKHDPVPGFRRAFFVALIAGISWLAYIFVSGAGGH